MGASTTSMVQANGINMQVVEQGKGPLVLLCHGFPETAHSWRHQIPALADAGFRVVAPDLRGSGGTDRPADVDQYTIFHLVGDVVGLLDAMGEEQAVIVGNDWGSTLAWQAAQMRPDRFRAVVALSVPMMDRPPLPPTRLFPQDDTGTFYTLYFQIPGTAEAEFERDVRTTISKILFAASGDAGPRKPGDGTPNPFGMVSRAQGLLAPLPMPRVMPAWLAADDVDVLTKAFAGSGFRGGLNLYRNMDRNWELQAGLRGAKVTVPALYMVGERDVGLSIPGMRQIIDDMPWLVPGLKDALVVPECGHWLQQENPGVVNSALVSFLQGLE